VRDVLPAALPGLSDRLFEESIRREWPRVAGPLARRSRPEWLRGNTLEIRVDNSAGLHEMRLRSEALLAAVQARFGAAVAALKFSLGEIPTGATPPTARRKPETVPRLSREESQRVDGLVAGLPDPMLAAALHRLVSRDLLARRPPDTSRLPGERPAPGREAP